MFLSKQPKSQASCVLPKGQGPLGNGETAKTVGVFSQKHPSAEGTGFLLQLRAWETLLCLSLSCLLVEAASNATPDQRSAKARSIAPLSPAEESTWPGQV